jgi:hypothetical protein
MTADAEGRAEYASPPCFAHELEPAFRGYAPVDRQQARDFAQGALCDGGDRRGDARRRRQTRPGMVVSLY